MNGGEKSEMKRKSSASPHSRSPVHARMATTLGKVLGDAVRPTLKDGVWRKPALSGRAASAARKLLAGDGDDA